MIEYTHKNGTFFSYSGVPFGEKSRPQELDFHLERCGRKPNSFQDECHVAARLLFKKAERLGRTPTVLLSGGLDSEAMCMALIELGLKFETATFRFSDGLNSHELYYVDKFSRRHGLNTRMFDISPLRIVRRPDVEQMYMRTFCSRPIMLSHMLLLSDVWERGGMPLVGGGDFVLKNQGGWKFCKYEYMLPWFRHADQNSIDCGIAFFQYTPELILSPLLEPEVQAILDPSNRAARVLSGARDQKYHMYQRFWPELEARRKFHGAEGIFNEYLIEMQRLNAKRVLQYEDIWSTPVERAISSLMFTATDVAVEEQGPP